MTQFEIIGYSKDYYVSGKYVGSITLTEPDRDLRGYYSRRNETLEQDIVLKGKKYKKGIQVMTELQTLCGKLLKNI